MAGKTHSKQICVFKTPKALLEFMDETKYENEPMAWPHSGTSRIRVHAKDYSEGVGDLAVDAFYNLSADEFYRMHSAVLKIRTTMANEYSRVKRHYDRLCAARTNGSAQSAATGHKEIEDIANQFANSSNDIFSEAGEQLKAALERLNSVQPNSGIIERMIRETEAELEELKSSREIVSELKILNYPQYANPENDEERRVTMFKLIYQPKMNYPYVFTIANGWGIPLITKLKGVIIKEGSTRFVDTVNICLDEKSLLPMLRRVELFIQAMTTIGLTKYYDAVTNPVLSYDLNDEE